MIKVTRDNFSVDEEIRYLKNPSVGGVVSFVGIVRGDSEGHKVERMEIEVYQEMAEKQLNEIRGEALRNFDVVDIRIVHRYGQLIVGDNIVLIAVSAGHRAKAFEACKYVIDELKKRVPIWKREYTPEGVSWVEGGKPE